MAGEIHFCSGFFIPLYRDSIYMLLFLLVLFHPKQYPSWGEEHKLLALCRWQRADLILVYNLGNLLQKNQQYRGRGTGAQFQAIFAQIWEVSTLHGSRISVAISGC